jgi:hypothetical protein
LRTRKLDKNQGAQAWIPSRSLFFLGLDSHSSVKAPQLPGISDFGFLLKGAALPPKSITHRRHSGAKGARARHAAGKNAVHWVRDSFGGLS